MSRIYVGCVAGGAWEVFRAEVEPTERTHGQRFNAVVGPFRTARAAHWLAHPVRGQRNPHCRCVADAERLAKLYAAEYAAAGGRWA